MIISCVSDVHGEYPDLEGGDLLIVAGDLTCSDFPSEYGRFFRWLHKQDYRKKVVIAGNHDGMLQYRCPKDLARQYCGDGFDDFDYLCDSGIEFEELKIWGSPWTPTFFNWFFMKDRGEQIREKWDLIPSDTDILVTHGPPHGVLDTISPDVKQKPLGCLDLLVAMERVKPKLHVFGHIHGGYGQKIYKHYDRSTLCVNASIMNEQYNPVNKPVRVEL